MPRSDASSQRKQVANAKTRQARITCGHLQMRTTRWAFFFFFFLPTQTSEPLTCTQAPGLRTAGTYFTTPQSGTSLSSRALPDKKTEASEAQPHLDMKNDRVFGPTFVCYVLRGYGRSDLHADSGSRTSRVSVRRA